MLLLSDPEKERLVRDDVQRHGWSLIYVIDEDEEDPPFAYSVGFFETFKHSEIIIVGTTEALASQIINNMGFRIGEEGAGYEEGRYYGDILERVDCYMHKVSKDCYPDYVGWNLWYYDGDDFPLLQCVYPCNQGFFPWNPEAPEMLQQYQPILGALPQQ